MYDADALVLPLALFATEDCRIGGGQGLEQKTDGRADRDVVVAGLMPEADTPVEGAVARGPVRGYSRRDRLTRHRGHDLPVGEQLDERHAVRLTLTQQHPAQPPKVRTRFSEHGVS